MSNYEQLTSLIGQELLGVVNEKDASKRSEKCTKLVSFLISALAAVAYLSLTKEGVDIFGDEIKKVYLEEIDRMEKESLMIDKAITNATEH